MSNLEHIDVFAGENRTLTLHARDASNDVLSLTGKTVAWYVGRGPFDPNSPHAMFSKTGTVTDAASGVFTVAIVPTDTESMQGDYLHRAVATTAATGAREVVSTGRFRVRPVLEA